MPELPEVETIVRDLRPILVGQAITGVDIHCKSSIATPGIDEFSAGLVGQRILGVDRRGKFIILHLERGDLLIHLRMTGRLLVMPGDQVSDCRYLRVVLALGQQRLLFADMRKFGRLYMVANAAEVLGKLGPEPLAGDFTVDGLAARLCKRRAPIKSLLLDQRILAGVGNIYADEALHAACIAPQRQACTLTRHEVTALHSAIRDELHRGIRNRGTTLSDYRDAAGREGEHRQCLRVYGRAGELCQRCGSAIVRVRIGGRSSFHCPRCQR